MDSDNGLTQRLALIRYYFREEPTTIDDLAKLWGQLVFALTFDGKLKEIEIPKG